MASEAFSGSAVKLKIGDGGVGAGTKASRTIGASNQQLILSAKDAGIAGNLKSTTLIVDGVNTPLSFTVTETALVINSATDGSELATTTVAQLISALYLNPTFVKHWQATVGVGNGSGVLVAAAAANLAGGLDGAELFSNVAEVKNIGGPNMSSTVIDVTNTDSLDNTREFISSWIDPGECSFTVNFLPNKLSQQALVTDMVNRTRRNFKLEWPDAPATAEFAGIITGFSITNTLDAVVEASVTVKITGFPAWF